MREHVTLATAYGQPTNKQTLGTVQRSSYSPSRSRNWRGRFFFSLECSQWRWLSFAIVQPWCLQSAYVRNVLRVGYINVECNDCIWNPCGYVARLYSLLLLYRIFLILTLLTRFFPNHLFSSAPYGADLKKNHIQFLQGIGRGTIIVVKGTHSDGVLN